MNKLKEYNKKRNFALTSEPEGKILTEKTKKSNLSARTSTKKLKKATSPSKAATKQKNIKKETKTAKTNSGGIFVVQYHAARRTHFDLRLEIDGVLASWAVPKGLSYYENEKRLAVHVEDHPLEYAKFEGVIPAGEYGAGEVLIWDTGVWHQTEENKGLKSGVLKFTLKGKRLKGKWALINISKGKDDNWIIIKEHDKYLNSDDLSKYVTSIKSGKTFEDLRATNAVKAKNPFNFVSPMLAKLADKIPSGLNFLYEIKYDGYRILASSEAGKTTLYSRNKTNYTTKFGGVAKLVTQLAKGGAMVLDGEVVVFDEKGKTDFQLLQNALRHKDASAACYVVFDLLSLNGKDLRNLPLIERKSMLEKLLKDAPSGLIYSSHTIGKGKQCFAAAKKMGLEGVVGKDKNSKYVSARNGDWIKIKCYMRQEFIIAGYTPSAVKPGLGALVLAVYQNKKLTFCGKAGTGFNEAEKLELLHLFKRLTQPACPFNPVPNALKNEQVVWLKPTTVCEIQFAEWTDENLLRQASYKGLRKDKPSTEVVNESLSK